MDAYALHLAMAALVGASCVAVSAYYMHRKTLTQLLEFAKSVEKERERERQRDANNNNEYSDDSPQHSKKRRGGGGGRRKGNGYSYYRRGSSSLPDVTVISSSAAPLSNGIDGDDKRSNGSPVVVDGIPPGLPRLSTLPEGMAMPDFSPGSA